jgi:glycosyltransferase involved in cell wall biosynthesis
VRRAALDDIGYFDADTGTCSDLELFVRFFKKYEGKIFPYRWAWCEENKDSLSNSQTPEQFQKYLNLVRAKHALDLPTISGRVTVAIPVRNMAQFIPHTLKSLREQTFQDFDIVVLDDASTDTTVEIVQTIVANTEMTNLRIIKTDENVGPNAAQNHMLAQCETPFFVVLAADDTVEPVFLERCLAQFAADPWLEFVGTQTDFITKEGTPLVEDHPFKHILKASNKSRDQWLAQLYHGNNYFGAGMYRTKAAQDLGGWDTTVGVLGDYDMYLKLLQRENIYVIEENLTHTRCHEGQRSVESDPAKARQWHMALRKNYHTIKQRYYQPRMKVVIATPFYEMRGFSPYIASLAATITTLTRLGIEHEWWELSGDSYVDRAKNTLFNKFLEDPAATDIFMIDSDMQWNVQAFVDMLMLPEGVLMGSYPQKNSWETWTARPLLKEQEGKFYPVGRTLPNGAAIIQAAYIAGGFMRIKRSVLEAYAEKYKDLNYVDPGADPAYPERVYTEFFTCERGQLDGEGPVLRWGEDRVFGRRLQAMGIDSWIYPKIDMGHYGVKGWTGNYDTFLRSQPKTA